MKRCQRFPKENRTRLSTPGPRVWLSCPAVKAVCTRGRPRGPLKAHADQLNDLHVCSGAADMGRTYEAFVRGLFVRQHSTLARAFDLGTIRGLEGLAGGRGGWHKASVLDCLPLAAPIGLSPLLILTPCGPECVLVVSTEPPDDLSCLTTDVR